MSPKSFGRLVLTLICLFAFNLQSHVTQTHIHWHSAPSTGIQSFVASADDTGNLPDSDDPDHCPYCQVAAHIGVYIMPSGIVFVADPAAHTREPQRVALALDCCGSHPWHSRGPPQV